ncbi:MAG: histidinol-phosphatase [Treponema sp.]|jgi:histidinol-phosphatase (PHP family)|nr:histidinol-phosphatase [Treponema sp.]
MRFSSLHTHSIYCDGTDEIETICRVSFEKGLVSLGFSSHAPLSLCRNTATEIPDTPWHMKAEKLPAYLAEIGEARKRWAGKLDIYSGLEADYIEGFASPAELRRRLPGLDYIIGSVHYIVPSGGAYFAVDGPPEGTERGFREGFGGDGEAFTGKYWDTVEAMIGEGGFDILGHVDILKKNNGEGRFFDPEDARYLRRAGEIAESALKAGIVVEVNTGGINRGRIPETYPSVKILRFFREAGVPALITSDAHRAEDLDGHYYIALQVLREAGYREHVLFQGRRNGKALWKHEALSG